MQGEIHGAEIEGTELGPEPYGGLKSLLHRHLGTAARRDAKQRITVCADAFHHTFEPFRIRTRASGLRMRT